MVTQRVRWMEGARRGPGETQRWRLGRAAGPRVCVSHQVALPPACVRPRSHPGDLGCPLKRVTIQLGCLLLGPSARVGAPCPLGPGLTPQHSHCAPLPQFPPDRKTGRRCFLTFTEGMLASSGQPKDDSSLLITELIISQSGHESSASRGALPD